MSLEEAILEKVRALPDDKKKQILDIVTSMSEHEKPKPALIDPKGMWAKYGITVTERDLDEARREMWVNFPRDDV